MRAVVFAFWPVTVLLVPSLTPLHSVAKLRALFSPGLASDGHIPAASWLTQQFLFLFLKRFIFIYAYLSV